MQSFVDSPIILFDDDLEVEARAVLARTPEPQNAFEVAVVLETLGYNDAVAQGLGADGLFDLARSVFAVMKDFGSLKRQPEPATASPRPPPRVRQFLGRGVFFSVPWITAILILLTTGAGFWSARVFTAPLSAGLTLGLFLALVVSGPFVQAFTRRATFYALQDRPGMVRWTARLMLGGGLATCAAVFVGSYFVLERVIGSYTPGTTRSFLQIGLAVCALQLAFAPLYTLRALRWMLVAVGVGTAVLVSGLAWVGQGLFVDPFDIVHVQLASIGAMVAVSLVGYWRLVGRVGRERGLAPRIGAVGRAVLPYALYGAGYFSLIIVDQLVAGGAWKGRFSYDTSYETAVGAALILVVPLFAYVVATSECFPRYLESRLSTLSVSGVDEFRSDCEAFYWRHLLVLVAVGFLLAGLMLATVELTAGRLSMSATLSQHLALFGAALSSYVFFTVGMLNSQLLLSVSRPGAPLRAVILGVTCSALVGGAAVTGLGSGTWAVTGLLVGTAVFAGWTTVAASRSFASFDSRLYAAF